MLGPHPLGVGPLGYAGAEYDTSVPGPFAQLLADPDRERRYAVVIEPWDVAGSTTVPLYTVSGRGSFTTDGTDTPAHTPFRPLGESPFRVDRAPSGLDAIGLGQLANTTVGRVVLPRDVDDDLLAWLPPAREWVGRKVSVYMGGMDFRFADYGLIGRFQVRDLEWDDGAITATLDTVARRFATPLPLPTFAGTGGLEGGLDLKAKPKPWCVGQVFNVEPVPVDPARLIYSLSHQALQAVTAVRDQGVALTPAGDVADITTGSPAPGTYVTQLSAGWIRLGSQPAGILTADAQGANAGGYAATPGALAVRVLALAGIPDSEIDAAGFADVDARAPYTCGIYLAGTAPSVQDLMARLMRSAGALWSVSRDGRITAQAWREPGYPADNFGPDRIVSGSLKRISTAAPAQIVRVAWRPNGRVQSGTELAGSLSAAQQEPYQQANRVAETVNAAVLTVHPYARTVEIETDIQVEAHANLLRDRVVTLLKPRRDLYRAEAVTQPLRREIGDTIALTYPRQGLAARRFRIVGLGEDSGQPTVTMTLWG